MIALLPLLLAVSSGRSGAVRLDAEHQPAEARREMCRKATYDALHGGTIGTMKSVNKLMAVMGLAEELSAKGVAGDIVEAGVAGGGGVMPLVFYLACTGDLANRTVYLFDTWKGLPPATDPHDDGFRKGEFNLKWNVFMETVEYYAKQYDQRVPSDPLAPQTALPSFEEVWNHVTPVKGLFADTMPEALARRKLALLMCDGDMYASTFDCMSSAGDLVVSGGAIYNDDYFMFKGCYDAVRDFTKGAAHRPMKGSLFFEDGDYQEFLEDSSACIPPAMNGGGVPPGTCWGRPVMGGILRVE